MFHDEPRNSQRSLYGNEKWLQVDSIHARTLTFMDDKSSFSKSFPALVVVLKKRPYKRLTDEEKEFKAWNFCRNFAVSVPQLY